MSITVVSPTGTKINRMPVTMLPQTTMFLIENKQIQDFSIKEKFETLDNFMKNFDIIEFYKGLKSNPISFTNQMLKKEAFVNNYESLKLLAHVFESVSLNHPNEVEKINQMIDEMNLAPSDKKTKKAKNEQRPTLKPGSGDDDDPKHKHKFEAPKLKR